MRQKKQELEIITCSAVETTQLGKCIGEKIGEGDILEILARLSDIVPEFPHESCAQEFPERAMGKKKNL